MSIVYEQADREVYELAQEILHQHHQHLALPDGTYPKLCILMASDEDPEGDGVPLKLHGYACAAVISVIPYKQRVDKRADAEILIDKARWESFNDLRRRALLDHEITHLEIQTDGDGCLKTDDEGRPKLKLRLHDWQLGGFNVIAKRYGADAIEVTEARAFAKDFGDAVLEKEALFG